MSKLINEIYNLIPDDTRQCNYTMQINAAKQIAGKCKDAAVKAILNQPARNMTRRQAIQSINKAFE